MTHLFWAIVAALLVRGAEKGTLNPGGCLKGVLIALVLLALLGALVSGGQCTLRTTG